MAVIKIPLRLGSDSDTELSRMFGQTHDVKLTVKNQATIAFPAMTLSEQTLQYRGRLFLIITKPLEQTRVFVFDCEDRGVLS